MLTDLQRFDGAGVDEPIGFVPADSQSVGNVLHSVAAYADYVSMICNACYSAKYRIYCFSPQVYDVYGWWLLLKLF